VAQVDVVDVSQPSKKLRPGAGGGPSRMLRVRMRDGETVVSAVEMEHIPALRCTRSKFRLVRTFKASCDPTLIVQLTCVLSLSPSVCSVKLCPGTKVKLQPGTAARFGVFQLRARDVTVRARSDQSMLTPFASLPLCVSPTCCDTRVSYIREVVYVSSQPRSWGDASIALQQLGRQNRSVLEGTLPWRKVDCGIRASFPRLSVIGV
jgi:hypothetical protein